MSEPTSSFVPVVHEVAVDAIGELRDRVLRGGQIQGEFRYPDDPAVHHLAVFDGDVVVSCATTFPEAFGGEDRAWRIRGMATAPEYQGRGCGRALLDAAVDRAKAADIPLLWCNVRTTALGFYQGCGFEIVGPEFITETGIPHRVALYRVSE